MKKIIITILAGFIGMSAMAATITFTNSSNISGAGALLYSSYFNNDNTIGNYTLLVTINGVEKSGAKINNWTGAYMNVHLGTAPNNGDITIITLTHKETNDCGVVTFTGPAFKESTACGGAVDPEPEPEPAGMLPIKQTESYFQGAGLFIKIDGWSCNPADTYYCSDDYTIVPDQSNTLTLGARTVGHGTHLHYPMSSSPANDDVINRFTVTHDDTGNCAVLTFTGYNCTAVEACGGVTPADPVSDFTIPAFIETKVGNTIKARATFKVNNAENLSIQLTDNASGFFSLGEPVLPNGGVGDAYIDITFAPTQAGTFTANLSITYNGGSATQAISATAVEAGSSEPGTIEFTRININNAEAAITSSSFSNTDISEYSVIAYQNDKTLDITITKTSVGSDILFVTKSGEYYSYPVTFEITNNKDNTCGKLIATSDKDFTGYPCDAATGVSIVSATPGVDYVDLAWRVNGYFPTHAVIYYKKTSEQNYSSMEASPIKRSARVLGLAANTQYDFYVRLEQRNNDVDEVDYIESKVVKATTTQATFTISQKGAYTNYLTIGWDANFTAELYTVRHRPTGSGLDYLQYELSGKATSATITGLDEHTSYDIQVVAQLSAAQGGSRTASGVFTTLSATSCNTISTEAEENDNSFSKDITCKFAKPYVIETYTTVDKEGKNVVHVRYQYTQEAPLDVIRLFKREANIDRIEESPMTREGNTNWYAGSVTGYNDDDYFYFAVKVAIAGSCENLKGETKITGGMYVTRKLNYKVGVGCNDATELEFTKGEGDKVFYLQSNATIARVEVYNPSGQLVDTPEITKPGPNYVLNIADDTTFPTGTYTFMLYDINGRLSDIDLVYTIY